MIFQLTFFGNDIKIIDREAKRLEKKLRDKERQKQFYEYKSVEDIK